MVERRLADKITDPETARAWIEAWRREGIEVAVVCGAFDLVGVEHARFLAAARGSTARLAVVLEDEAGTHGKGGALLAATERAILVASLRVVDLVVTDGGASSDPKALARPDVAARGARESEPARGAAEFEPPAPRAPSSARLRERVIAAHERTR